MYVAGPDDLYSQNSLALPGNFVSSYAAENQFVLQQTAASFQPQGDLYGPNPPLYNSYIIGAAANLLQCSPEYLIESTYFNCSQYKRQRRTFELDHLSMSQQYSEDFSRHDPGFEGYEPLHLCGHDDGHHHGCFPLPLSNSGAFLASTASGVADCLAGLTTCQRPVNDGPLSGMLFLMSFPSSVLVLMYSDGRLYPFHLGWLWHKCTTCYRSLMSGML